MKSLGVIAQIVKTHLLSRKRQTVVASLGVTFGIGLYIAMAGFMNGSNKLTEDLMLSGTPHIHIYNDVRVDTQQVAQRVFTGKEQLVVVHNPKPQDKPKNIKDGMQILSFIKNDKRVYGASPRVTSQVLYNYGVSELPGTILGVDLLEENKLFALRDKITEGTLEKVLATDNGIMMGGGLADKMNVHVNDHVTVTLTSGTKITLTVCAIFRLGFAFVDNVQSYATVNTVQKLLHKDKLYITDINIKLNNLNDAKEYSKELQAQFGYTADDWETTNASVLVGIVLRNIITYTVSVAMLIVAGFGIYNIMTMMMYEKMKDIAILKAIGFDAYDIRRIFLGEALALGVIGGCVGLLMGLLLSLLLYSIPYKNEYLPGMEHLPMDFSMWYYIVGIVFALVSSATAGWFPARKAAHVDPVIIIRG